MRRQKQDFIDKGRPDMLAGYKRQREFTKSKICADDHGGTPLCRRQVGKGKCRENNVSACQWRSEYHP